MPNAVLDRLEAQRAEQIQFIDNLLARVDTDGRDLVDAETANLTAARERIAELDQQISPLRDFESLRGDAAAGTARALGPADGGEPRGLATGGHSYASAGAFIVDRLRARGVPWANLAPDPAAAARIAAAVENQLTTDTPGLLPVPVVGDVVNTIDASRPFLTSIGVRSMGGIPGKQFSRPKITQHVAVGKQAAEKTQLPSRKMIIGSVDFIKETYGGTVDISRQDIDWTSPSAWDALVRDLAAVYAAETENAVADAFAAAVTQNVDAATGDLAGWVAALYQAAAKAYAGGAAAGTTPMGKLPNRLWMSIDMWATFGSLVDQARVILNPGALGSGDLSTFAGDMLGVPRVVVPSFPAGTAILGPSDGYEAYEEMIGLLSAVEPSLFGVEVAYGGYVAHGMINAAQFCKITAPPVVPLGAASTPTATATPTAATAK